ncbi:MAG: carboxylating nicotinate-nucleotide diphosphorylase [Armatimonadetes bacterium]|nr:carboxylating nicotinate-nucleotide diphosphorylase [Armatimonadota bacterium]
MWNQEKIRRLILESLEEDIPFADITSQPLSGGDRMALGQFISRGTGIVCGLPIVRKVFECLDPSVQFQTELSDGSPVKEGQTLGWVRGRAWVLLAGERTALNFLQHLSGIATLTRKFVDLVSTYEVAIVDTRKTLPGLRVLQKYAVRCGGGQNHRFSLSDAVLIKDNHIRLCGGIRLAVETIRKKTYPPRAIQVEVTNLSDLGEALECNVEAILLDNMDLDLLRRCVQLVDHHCRQTGQKRPILEASGTVTLENVRQIAAAGVDAISIGALTHSAPALDISLEVSPLPVKASSPGAVTKREAREGAREGKGR